MTDFGWEWATPDPETPRDAARRRLQAIEDKMVYAALSEDPAAQLDDLGEVAALLALHPDLEVPRW